MIILPKNDLAKQEILKKIVIRFSFNKKYSEEEVNEVIKSFDVDDFILFRRELINFGYLQRDPYKREYWLKKKKLSKEELGKINKNQMNIKKL